VKWLEIDWQFVNRNCYRLSCVSWAFAQISCFLCCQHGNSWFAAVSLMKFWTYVHVDSRKNLVEFQADGSNVKITRLDFRILYHCKIGLCCLYLLPVAIGWCWCNCYKYCSMPWTCCARFDSLICKLITFFISEYFVFLYSLTFSSADNIFSELTYTTGPWREGIGVVCYPGFHDVWGPCCHS